MALSLAKDAVPLIFSTGCFALTLFTDRTLLLLYDPIQAGAAMAAGNMYWTFACVPVVSAGIATTFYAQLLGRNQRAEVHRVLWQGIWFSLLATPLFILAGVFAPVIFRWAGHDSSLVNYESIYFRILMLGALASTLEPVLSGLFVARGQGRPIVVANVVATVTNVILDVLLIYGVSVSPELGLQGAAIATVTASWLKIACYVLLLSREQKSEPTNQLQWKPDRGVIVHLSKTGLPLGAQQLFKSFALTAALVGIGTIGDEALAATSAAVSINQLFLLPLTGIAAAVVVATATEVGMFQHVSKTLIRSVLFLAAIFLFLVATTYFGLWDSILHALLATEAAESDAQILLLAAGLLTPALLLVVADTSLQLMVAIVRGVGATRYIFFATMVSTVAYGLVSAIILSNVGLTLTSYWIFLVGWTGVQAVAVSTYWLQRQTSSRIGTDILHRFPFDGRETADASVIGNENTV